MSQTLLERLRLICTLRQWLRMQAREEMVPDDIQNPLHIGGAACHRQNHLLLREHDAKLPKGPVSPIGLMPTAPELEAVALGPITVRIISAGNLHAGRDRKSV